MKSIFGIIGGDKRQLYLARSLEDDGYKVFICGFELLSETRGLLEEPLIGIFKKCDNIILPLPCSKDGITISAPYSSKDIIADWEFVKNLEGKTVYGGFIDKLVKEQPLWKKVNIKDYYLREELAISSALATAEGAISLAVTEHAGILCGSKCLVTGYGRIGKILTKCLLALGAKVTVTARKNSDLSMIKSMGAEAKRYSEIKKEYDIIFNTVPELVIDKNILARQSTDTVIIELASLPGGIDRKCADINQIKIVDAQSLPGKFAPKASGVFIKETIYNMIDEIQL